MLVTSVSLEQLVLKINRCSVPTTFDLGGFTLIHEAASSDVRPASIILNASNVTLLNGVIRHSARYDKEAPGLHIQGKNVTLKALKIFGGGWGVLVLPGGSAEIINCEVSGCFAGLGVGQFFNGRHSDAKITVSGVKVAQCASHGLSVGSGGSADVQRCNFFNNGRHGISIHGLNPSGSLVASYVNCKGNKSRGLCVAVQGRAVLFKCDLTENSSGSLYVQDEHSLVTHNECVLDSRVDARINGEIRNVSMVREPSG